MTTVSSGRGVRPKQEERHSWVLQGGDLWEPTWEKGRELGPSRGDSTVGPFLSRAHDYPLSTLTRSSCATLRSVARIKPSDQNQVGKGSF